MNQKIKEVSERFEGFEGLIQEIEDTDWSISDIEDEYISLQIYSSYGQDFNITVKLGNDKDEFLENLYRYYDGFDVSYETYLWLDDEGHGKNGAPYDMKDVYEDMEECESFILDLYGTLKSNK